MIERLDRIQTKVDVIRTRVEVLEVENVKSIPCKLDGIILLFENYVPIQIILYSN